MNLSRPIPKALLPHNVVLRTPKVENRLFADEEYDEVTLYNVRVEQNERVRQGKAGEIKTKGACMYYDRINSGNSGAKAIQFKPEQLVIFGGESYKIEAVRTVMAATEIHHYKIDLV